MISHYISQAFRHHILRFGLIPVALTLSLVVSAGCNIGPGLGSIGSSIDNAVVVLDRGISTLENESADWQTVLQETRDQLIQQGQSTVANEVNSVMTRAIATTGVEFRCNVDFVRTRVRQDLIRIKAKLLGQPVPEKEPAFCQVDPSGVGVELIAQGRLNLLQYYGYDFDTDTTNLKILLQKGAQQIDISQYRDTPTHYHMTLNLARLKNDGKLTADTQRFILRWKDKDLATVAITHAPPKTPTAPPLPACIPTDSTSEEKADAVCPSGFAIKGIKCAGKYCDNIALDCCPYWHTEDSQRRVQWSEWFSEEKSRDSITTNTGFLAALQCRGEYCDSMRLSTLITPHLKNAGQCTYITSVSEESGRNENKCPDSYFAAGMRCSGEYCDNVSLYCCKYEIAR